MKAQDPTHLNFTSPVSFGLDLLCHVFQALLQSIVVQDALRHLFQKRDVSLQLAAPFEKLQSRHAAPRNRGPAARLLP